MVEVVVLSGKGGTGKTSLTAAFAHLSKNHVICDLDVDAPDLHLLAHPRKLKVEEFWSGHEARILEDKCEPCGQCIERCRFDAVRNEKPIPRIDPLKCEGCRVCVEFCPANAIEFPEKQCGEWYLSDTRFGPMVHAQLFPAEENSGRLVALLRQAAKAVAEEQALELVLSDGPPGIGCPVISSLSGTSYAVIVTEPTPSGRHDLQRVAELCQHFQVPAGVIINKCDLNEHQDRQIEAFCAERSLKLLGRLPHDTSITRAMINGQAVTEYQANGFSRTLKQIWSNIMSQAKIR